MMFHHRFCAGSVCALSPMDSLFVQCHTRFLLNWVLKKVSNGLNQTACSFVRSQYKLFTLLAHSPLFTSVTKTDM